MSNDFRRSSDNGRGDFRNSDSNRNNSRDGFKRRDDRGEFKRSEDRGGFRNDRRDDNRGGFRQDRDDNRGGFKRNEDRGGFRNDRRDDNRGGFKRNEDRGGFRNDRRDDNRGGFKRNEDRGGFRQDRDDNRGGFKRNEDRGGFRNDRRDDNRGGFKRNDDRGNFRKDDRSKGDRPARGQRFEDPRAEAARPHNPGDLRISNRADRSQSPDIDEDVTGKELDRVARAQLRYLEERSASWVAKHLVMAGRLLEEDPELAYEHTLAASRRGGRVAVVREAVGIAAYHAGKYADALRELRTHRRISGSDYNLPLIADSLRALGRPEKAIELAHSEESANLEAAVKVEMQIVAAGAYGDQGKLDEALAELESLEQLNFNRAFSFSPRLFTAYADLLSAAGRSEDAKRWNQQVEVAERALGIEQETESFIMDLAPEMDEEEEAPRAKDLIESGQDEEDAEDAEVAESGIDEEDGLVEIAESDTEAEPADAEDESSK